MNNVEKGIEESDAPITFSFSGLDTTKASIPCIILPSPIYIKPNTGTRVPPIKSPTAFTVSETATAFKPPKIAYKEPTIPMDQTVMVSAVSSDTPSTVGTSNIPFNASDPEYKTIGSNTTI